MALNKEDIFKKKPSKEEMVYKTAVELMEAIEYVEQFERAVRSLESAAKKLESLGEYKDASMRMTQARKQAAELAQKGCEETFQRAEKMRKNAKSKSDFIAASSEYRRLVSFAAYKEQGEQGQLLCQKGIRKVETKRIYLQRTAVILVLAVICVVVMQTPLQFVVKGVGHKVMKEYHAAIKCYEKADYLPGVNKMKRSCYYKIAKQYDEDNHHKRAMKVYRMAGAYADAEFCTTRYQKRFIRKAQIGDVVYYGGMRWIVLEKDEATESALLVKKSPLQEEDFADGTVLSGNALDTYLNEGYINANFTDREKVMMGYEVEAKKRAGVETVQVEPEYVVKKPISVMGTEIIREYQEILPDGWDAGGVHLLVKVRYH